MTKNGVMSITRWDKPGNLIAHWNFKVKLCNDSRYWSANIHQSLSLGILFRLDPVMQGIF